VLSAISLGGQVDGKRLLSPETIDKIFQEQVYGVDVVLQQPVRLGTGFGLPGKDTFIDWLPGGRICLWGGWGGSIGLMDCDRHLTISYVMNKMENVGIGSDRTKAYVKAIYAALGVPSM
jgi:CubicO group peptidase (beta-lactamase class C family)